VQRVIKLLTVAKESGNDAERLTAYAKARTELARLERAGRIHLPKAAMAALSASARTGLPGGFAPSGRPGAGTGTPTPPETTPPDPADGFAGMTRVAPAAAPGHPGSPVTRASGSRWS